MQLGRRRYQKEVSYLIRTELKQKYPGLMLVDLKRISNDLGKSVHDLYVLNEYGRINNGNMKKKVAS